MMLADLAGHAGIKDVSERPSDLVSAGLVVRKKKDDGYD